MTSVFSFEAQFFNQNGDQGNLAVLEHVTGKKLLKIDDPTADLVIIGDASRAAMRRFTPELTALIPAIEQRLREGLPTLLVGSSFEFYCEQSDVLPTLTRGPRESKFVTVNHGGSQVVGYRNSDVLGSELFVRGCFVGTLLFGPILAKNPDLLRLFSESLGLKLEVQNSYWQLTEQVRANLIFD